MTSVSSTTHSSLTAVFARPPSAGRTEVSNKGNESTQPSDSQAAIIKARHERLSSANKASGLQTYGADGRHSARPSSFDRSAAPQGDTSRLAAARSAKEATEGANSVDRTA